MKNPLALALAGFLAVACQTSAPDQKSTVAQPAAVEPLPAWTKATSPGDSGQHVLVALKLIEVTRPLGDPETPTETYRKELTDPECQVFIRKLMHTKGADLMTTPNMVARDGQSAKVEIVRDFVYPISPGEGAPTATEKTGVTSYVLARPSKDKRTIQLKTLTEVSDFVGFSEVSPDFEKPVFQKRRAGATVEVKDGGSIIFGGNVYEKSREIEDSGPLGLIKRRSTEKFTIKLIVVVSPRLIDPNGQPLAAMKVER